ncbi:hypothetical protein D9M70_653010 [compost metagenome]
MLVGEFTHRGADSLVEAGSIRFEQVGEGRLVTIGVVQQRADFPDVGTVEQADFGGGLRHGHVSCCGYVSSLEH